MKRWKLRPRGRGVRKIVLNARDNAVQFYWKHGYEVIGDAETLFGVICHVLDGKVIIVSYRSPLIY